MNSCILMAQIVSEPELRSTQDHLNVSSMMVEFESSKEGETTDKVQVEGWGGLAEEIKNTYSAGDQVIIEGRLAMSLFEMPEGYKEKRAKLIASRIYPVSGLGSGTSTTVSSQSYQSANNTPDNNVVDFVTSQKSASIKSNTPAPSEPAVSDSGSNEDWDEIPF